MKLLSYTKILKYVKNAGICRIMYFLSIDLILVSFTACDKNPVQSLRFATDRLELQVGEKDTLELFINPLSASNYGMIMWKSSDNSVAQVNQQGEVIAVYTGQCTITASYRDIKATAQIIVNPPNINVEFSQAAAFFYGDCYNEGLNIIVLHLLSDGYNIADNGDIFGTGYSFNAEIRLHISQTTLINGSFVPSYGYAPYTYLPGTFQEHEDKVHLFGTYLELVSLNGKMAILVKDGILSLANNVSVFDISGTFTGNQKEVINISFKGNVKFFDKTVSLQDTIFFDHITAFLEQKGDIYMWGKNIFRLTLSNSSSDSLILEFVAPLSASHLPTGIYSISNGSDIFSLVSSDISIPQGSFIIHNGVVKSITYGIVEVFNSDNNEKKFKISLISGDNHIIN